MNPSQTTTLEVAISAFSVTVVKYNTRPCPYLPYLFNFVQQVNNADITIKFIRLLSDVSDYIPSDMLQQTFNLVVANIGCNQVCLVVLK